MQLNLYELHDGENPAKEKLTQLDFDCNDLENAAIKLTSVYF